MTPVVISVIIPAYNAEETLAEAIRAVLAQTVDVPFELIVVDDGSTDNTAGVVHAFPGVRYFFQDNSGPARARNRGAAEAAGEFLCFTDADCRPEPGWLVQMVRPFNDPQVKVVAGSYGIANPQERLARIIHAEIRFRHLELIPEYPRAFGSYNFAVRAGLFLQLGGFNPSYRQASGEDNDLSYRVLRSGAKIRFISDACVEHYHQHLPGRYLREQFRHGFWRARLYADHAGMAAGDDYTFWKDIVEVPLVIMNIVSFGWPQACVWVTGGFLFFEILAGLRMIGFSLDGLCGGLVMWLRSFTRCAGILVGGLSLLKNRFPESKKT